MTAAPIKIDLPATSANLGPGFDSIALAMDLWLKISARPAKRTELTALGRDHDICQEARDNLVLTTYQSILETEGIESMPLRLRIRNGIPIGKGCGSSAAARLAGILLANYFGGLHWTKDRVLCKAAELEGHADNVAACLMGGVVLVRSGCDGGMLSERIRLKHPKRWPILLALPPQALSTGESRTVLPDSYTRADAVSNLQNAMLLVSSFISGNRRLFRTAMTDRFHEPYREKLCPLLHCLKPLAGDDGVLGVSLSGAGPSVLLFLDPDHPQSAIRRRVQRHLAQSGFTAELLHTSIGGGCRTQVGSRA